MKSDGGDVGDDLLDGDVDQATAGGVVARRVGHEGGDAEVGVVVGCLADFGYEVFAVRCAINVGSMDMLGK